MHAEEKEQHYSFFQNRACEYFPCHEGVPEEEFNCLFCYCPLYALGKGCGGRCRYTEKGMKDCACCTFPHERRNYRKILARYKEIMDVARRMDALREDGEDTE